MNVECKWQYLNQISATLRLTSPAKKNNNQLAINDTCSEIQIRLNECISGLQKLEKACIEKSYKSTGTVNC